MSEAAHLPDGVQSATERLLEYSWDARVRRGSAREILVEATAGGLFVMAAVSVLLVGGLPGLRPGLVALLIAVYAVVGRVEFPVGAGHVVPTQLILVPMLVVLPPGAVPAAALCGLVAGSVIGWALGRVPPRRVLSAVPDAWHAIGPPVVLLLAGSPRLDFGTLPLLAAAVGAGFIFDLASALARMRLAGVVPDLRLQMRVIARVWTVDASLAPLGFLAALATRQHDVAPLFVLPLAFLLSVLARDRNQRIDEAHRRLKLVERERARLQSAVRRLGDAFAAKLELRSLLEILLHGSVEALDAAAGQLDLAYGRSPIQLAVGCDAELAAPDTRLSAGDAAGPVQITREGTCHLSARIRVATSSGAVEGELRLVRAGRAFEEDEIAVISELLGKAELAAAEIIAHHTIREQAMTDSLTGLGNRRRLTNDLSAAFEDVTTAPPSLLLLFDLDGFKNYNDTFGHLAGDALLARLAGELKRAVDGHGRAYRLGGDEFCAHVVLDGSDTDPLIRRAATALSETGAGFSIDASVGVVLLPHEADSAEHALQIADQRMYANKRGRSTAVRSQAGELLLRTMHAKQPDLDQHSSQVAELAARVARRMGMGGETVDDISVAAQLHDIGKVGIPDAILNKAAPLNQPEWELIRNHTILGERILHGAPALRPAARMVRASHERWDGSGYPDQLSHEEIPIGARIVSVCDAYEAMTAERTYRSALSPARACQELIRCAGAQFDPDVVDAFLSVIHSDAEDREPDAAHHAVVHVQALLGAGDDRRYERRSSPARSHFEHSCA